jgi:hypothetical protein
VPFDEQHLEVALGLRDGQLEAYLYDDHRSISLLAAERGVAVDALAAGLVAWAPDDRRRLLHDRAVRILTQPHLAQHVFFFIFHGLDSAQEADAIFGVSRESFWNGRLAGKTPTAIARAGGVDPRSVLESLQARLDAKQQEGVRLGVAPPAAARIMLSRQLARLPCWLRRPLPGLDPTNPYGKAHHLHGGHARDWPATATQRRAAGRRVERFRRVLRPSCWPRPERWRARPR